MPTDSDKQSLDLSAIDVEELPQNTSDQKAREEERALELAQKEAELDALKQDISERKQYAKRIFNLIRAWLIGIFCLLLLQGFLSNLGLFDLSEAVILAVVGGTTLNVLGIFIVVVNYLFPKR